MKNFWFKFLLPIFVLTYGGGYSQVADPVETSPDEAVSAFPTSYIDLSPMLSSDPTGPIKGVIFILEKGEPVWAKNFSAPAGHFTDKISLESEKDIVLKTLWQRGISDESLEVEVFSSVTSPLRK